MIASIRAALCIFAVLSFDSRAEIDVEAEAVTKRYLHAVLKFNVPAFVEELHPDLHQLFHRTMIQAVKAEKPGADRAAALKSLGAESLQDIEKLTSKAGAERFFRAAFSQHVSDKARKASLEATTVIIGAVPEKERLHVLYRVETDALDLSGNVPFTLTLVKSSGRWKVSNSTEMIKFRREARALGVR